MLKDFGSILDVVAVAAAALSVAGLGCSSSSTSATNPSMKEAGCAAKEAGCAAKEAGCAAKEAGCAAKEAGCAAKEAGCAATEAGCAAKEAGCAAVDAGGTAQTPPTGGANVEAWLAMGAYKSWACEPAVHAARSPSPHGFNRICSNDLISTNATGTGAWPMGAAAVKELYATMTSTAPMGYAVYLKQQAASMAGDNWYWYERSGSMVVADGEGTSGPPNTICVGCHTAAGSDAAHMPSPNSRDFVYTPVP